jgi:hypothetical protein
MERYYTKGCVVIDREDLCIVRILHDAMEAEQICRFMNYTWGHNS